MTGVCCELVYLAIPSPCTVVVVVGDISSTLGESVQHCLLHTGTTVHVIREEDLQTVPPCKLVVAAQLCADTAAVRTNTMARDSLTYFLYCKMVSALATVMCSMTRGSSQVMVMVVNTFVMMVCLYMWVLLSKGRRRKSVVLIVTRLTTWRWESA